MKPLQVLIALFAFAFLPLHAAGLDDLTYTTTNGEVTITDCDTDATGELVIPNTIDGNPVTSIGSNAFYYCSSLTSITIPNSVTSIGEVAFYNCSSLTSITIPDSVTSIERYTFWNCSSLTSITIPDSVTSIGNRAFWNCTSLTSIMIPDSVTTIGYRAFDSCTSLTSITIPDSLTHIGRGVFVGTPTVFTEVENINFLLGREAKRAYLIEGSQALGAVDLPAMVEGAEVSLISDSAFRDCTNLTSITIPDSVTSIGESAFRDCASLTSITIPDGVTSIGNAAFQRCTSLTSITIPDRFSAHYSRIGLTADQSQPLFNKAVAANDTVSSNTTRIEAIEAQLALLADALAAKDAEIANKNERITQLEDLSDVPLFNLLLEEKDEQIAALELRPTQAAYDTVVTERDARPTLEEIQDARTGSVILTPSEDGTVQLKIEIEESSDLEVWENQGKSVEADFPLAEGKKFLRFALK